MGKLIDNQASSPALHRYAPKIMRALNVKSVKGKCGEHQFYVKDGKDGEKGERT